MLEKVRAKRYDLREVAEFHNKYKGYVLFGEHLSKQPIAKSEIHV